jgi:hypothetical protein
MLAIKRQYLKRMRNSEAIYGNAMERKNTMASFVGVD